MERNRTSQSSFDTYRIMAVSAFSSRCQGIAGAVDVSTGHQDPLGYVMAAMSPGIAVMVPKEYCPSGQIVFDPRSIGDFELPAMMRRQPYLATLAEAQELACSAHRLGLSHREVETRLQGLLPGLQLDCSPPERASAGVSAAQGEGHAHLIDDLLSLVDTGVDGLSDGVPGGDSFHALQMQLEEVIRQCLRLVFNDLSFRSFEAAWGGAELLIRHIPEQAGQGRTVEFTLVSSEADALDELFSALRELAPSKLPNLLLLDFPITNTPVGTGLLERIIDMADQLMLPVAAWVGADFFGLESWREVGRLSYVKSFLEQAGYAKWRKCRELGGAAWAMLLMNRIPVRRPHAGLELDGTYIRIREKEQLWTSPVWAFGSLVAATVTATGWPVGCADRQRFRLEALPLQETETIPLEALISDERIGQFLDAGFCPLSSARHDDAVYLCGLAAINGESWVFRLYFGMLVAFLIRLHDSGDEQHSATGSWVRGQLAAFISIGGYGVPDDLEVEIVADPGRCARLLNIAFTPWPGQLDAGRVEFCIRW